MSELRRWQGPPKVDLMRHRFERAPRLTLCPNSEEYDRQSVPLLQEGCSEGASAHLPAVWS